MSGIKIITAEDKFAVSIQNSVFELIRWIGFYFTRRPWQLTQVTVAITWKFLCEQDDTPNRSITWSVGPKAHVRISMETARKLRADIEYNKFIFHVSGKQQDKWYIYIYIFFHKIKIFLKKFLTNFVSFISIVLKSFFKKKKFLLLIL